jgi:hypothetical protein
MMPLRLMFGQILEILDQALDAQPSPPIINRLGGKSKCPEADKIQDDQGII